ncbi:hypothetical protein K438DRAFT_1991580 [Mycena galopus ATCC 62051]|nr:hypothetical protein K438DRAFT_1991580 [Mycena galopus ATCC 62051]
MPAPSAMSNGTSMSMGECSRSRRRSPCSAGTSTASMHPVPRSPPPSSYYSPPRADPDQPVSWQMSLGSRRSPRLPLHHHEILGGAHCTELGVDEVVVLLLIAGAGPYTAARDLRTVDMLAAVSSSDSVLDSPSLCSRSPYSYALSTEIGLRVLELCRFKFDCICVDDEQPRGATSVSAPTITSLALRTGDRSSGGAPPIEPTPSPIAIPELADTLCVCLRIVTNRGETYAGCLWVKSTKMQI